VPPFLEKPVVYPSDGLFVDCGHRVYEGCGHFLGDAACYNNYVDGAISSLLLGLSGDEVYDKMIKYRKGSKKTCDARAG